MQDIGKIYRFSKIDTLPIILFKILRLHSNTDFSSTNETCNLTKGVVKQNQFYS